MLRTCGRVNIIPFGLVTATRGTVEDASATVAIPLLAKTCIAAFTDPAVNGPPNPPDGDSWLRC